jgi:hypothetical protein
LASSRLLVIRMADIRPYKSNFIGRQDMLGPAVERIAAATDTNSAARVDNEKWYAALLKYRALLDRVHDRVLKD